MEDLGLNRFLEAQSVSYANALSEIRRGQKRSHWMWFIFPQLMGLGSSEMARRYGVRGLSEARAYLEHPVLGARLGECVNALQDLPLKQPEQVFGAVDAQKLRSSLTLFVRAEAGPLFEAALQRWFPEGPDPTTDHLLKAGRMGDGRPSVVALTWEDDAGAKTR